MKIIIPLFLIMMLPFNIIAGSQGKNQSSCISKMEQTSKEIFNKERMNAMYDMIHQGNTALIKGIKTGTSFVTDWSIRIFGLQWIPYLQSKNGFLAKCQDFLSLEWLIQPILSK